MTKLVHGFLAFIILGSCACSTIVPIAEQKPIEVGRVDKGKTLGSVLMQYKFNVPNDQHIIYLWDEDKNRYDVHVPGNLDTSRGIVFNLPTGKRYAVVSLYIYLQNGKEFIFGDNLDTFSVDPTKLTVLPYFELETPKDRLSFFAVEKESNEIYLSAVKSHFGELPPHRFAKIKLINDFKLR